MADVLIVCVREDEPRAKALADMFEAAGFSIGGAPSSDAALRSSGAGVVVWSQASIRSRPFLDAAQRVINANKAVVASLIEPPPPSSIGDSPAFDLSHWDGDPDDQSLDPLFFAVDRMVNAARAAVAVSADAQPKQDYTPQRAAPLPRAAPPPPPPPPPSAADPLDSEAALWRSIRNSRDPAVFLDYLARFGPDGEFADVAELRLKQLTSAEPEPRSARAPIPAPPAPPPRRPEPPPVRAEAPPPRPEPRYAPEPPPRRREPPPPLYDGRYDRLEAREPRAQSGGGGLRWLVIILLLGGAAAAGALYLGDGRMGAPPSEEILADAQEAPSSTGPSADGAQTLAAPSQELAAIAEEPTSIEAPPPAREATQRQEAQREQTQQRVREEPEPPTPAPVANFDVAENRPRAAVPLSPAAPAPVPLRPAPAAPPPAAAAPAPTAAPAPAATPARPLPPGEVRWAQRPSARVVSRSYPRRALRDGIDGSVTLNCTVLPNLSLSCSVASESPAGMGFGAAALTIVRSYRAEAQLSNGAPAAGSRARVPIMFRTAD